MERRNERKDFFDRSKKDLVSKNARLLSSKPRLTYACKSIKKPEIIVGDKAYDSDKMDEQLIKKNIKLISPHKKNRKSPRTQNEDEIKTIYKKRWCVERFFAWTKSARRLLSRFDKKHKVFQAFIDIFGTFSLMHNIL